jgi:multicomponent Na+:H+ antiporter subunit A
MRLTPVLGNQELWNSTLIIVGAVTMVYSAIHIIFRTDLKGILAYSTISALGILVFLIGQGTVDAFFAAAVFIIVHALYKATLFLVTGIIDLQTGTRDTTKLRGLGRVLFPVAIAGFLAAISSAGIPPSIGFICKELTYESTMHVVNSPVLWIALIIITKILLLYGGFVAGIRPFAGRLPEKHKDVTLPSILLWLPPVLLALGGILFGVLPSLIDEPIIKPVVSAMGVNGSEIHLKLWHGFSTVLWLSLFTITAGTIMYFVMKPTKALEAKIARLEFISPHTISTKLWAFGNKFASLWTKFFQNGYLRNYVSTIIVVLIGLLGYTLFNVATFSVDYSTFSVNDDISVILNLN